MTIADRLRQLVSVLPSDASAVTLTRADLEAMLQEGPDVGSPLARDLTVERVAEETGRAPSTVRGWLISGALKGYKLNGRDWRIPPASLRAYLEAQAAESEEAGQVGEVNLGAWRGLRGGKAT